MISLKPYDLPDAGLMDGTETGIDHMVWIPGFTCVVLGQSNDVGTSVHEAPVLADGIPVYKRPSGGETVVLSPRTVVISAVKRNEPLRAPRRYFALFNDIVIAALRSLGIGDRRENGIGDRRENGVGGIGDRRENGVGDIRQNGISDICIGDKKILGSSIYRNKDLLLYHAVLNLSEPVAGLERYLKHPSREPEYRAKRSHSDFVTSLAVEGYDFTAEELKGALLKAFAFGDQGALLPRGAGSQ